MPSPPSLCGILQTEPSYLCILHKSSTSHTEYIVHWVPSTSWVHPTLSTSHKLSIWPRWVYPTLGTLYKLDTYPDEHMLYWAHSTRWVYAQVSATWLIAQYKLSASYTGYTPQAEYIARWVHPTLGILYKLGILLTWVYPTLSSSFYTGYTPQAEHIPHWVVHSSPNTVYKLSSFHTEYALQRTSPAKMN